MTDTDLNEAIARLMGWTPKGMAWRNPGGALVDNVPDYLDPKLLPELMDLADRVLPTWALGHDKDARMHVAKTERLFCIEESRSKAVARAIVAHAEGEEQPRTPTTGEQVTISCPAPPE